jgi:uncharacterized lipoprotein YbaY
MKRFVRLALPLIGAVALAGCSMFDHPQPAPTPQTAPTRQPAQPRSSGDNTDAHHGLLGPGTTAPNSD